MANDFGAHQYIVSYPPIYSAAPKILGEFDLQIVNIFHAVIEIQYLLMTRFRMRVVCRIIAS